MRIVAPVAPPDVSVATPGSIAEGRTGAPIAAERTDPIWPRDMDLLSATRNILDAKADFYAAIARATTNSELIQIARVAENLMKGFESIGATALMKAEHL